MSESFRPRLLPPVILIGSMAVQVLFDMFSPGVRDIIPAPWSYGGVALVVLGVAINATAAFSFLKHKTTIIPGQESDALVTTGLFRWSRNPMYTGMVLILFGTATVLASVTPWFVPFAFVWIVTKRFIEREEAMLTEKFGPIYLEYCQNVRRWL